MNTSGTNTFSAGMQLGNTTNTGKSVNLVAAGGGTVVFSGAIARNGTDTTAGLTINDTYTVNGAPVTPSGTVSLTNVGNTYAGQTIIAGGTLKLSGASTNNIPSSSKILVGDTLAHNTAVLDVTGLTNGAITLGANQALAGYGTVTGAVTGSASGTVAPGNGLGQLTVNGNFDLGGGKLGIELSKTNAHAGGGQQVAGTDYDQLIVSGASTVSVNGGTLAITFGNNLVSGDVFYVLDNQGSGSAAADGQFYVATINGTTAQIGGVDTSASNQLTNGSTFTAAGYSFTINYDASVSGTSNDISLTAVSVPEPTIAGALLGLAGTGLLMRRRRMA
jgi:autotransporter-associated beta strand protein